MVVFRGAEIEAWEAGGADGVHASDSVGRPPGSGPRCACGASETPAALGGGGPVTAYLGRPFVKEDRTAQITFCICV